MSTIRSYGNVILYVSQFKELDIIIGKLTIIGYIYTLQDWCFANLFWEANSLHDVMFLWHKGTLTGNNT